MIIMIMLMRIVMMMMKIMTMIVGPKTHALAGSSYLTIVIRTMTIMMMMK